MQLCFFGDSTENNLKPLTLTRPADQLRLGFLKICEKWSFALNNPSITRLISEQMKGVFDTPSINSESPSVWINNRYIPDGIVSKEITNLTPGRGLIFENHPVVICLSGVESKRLHNSGFFIPNDITFKETKAGSLINHVWDIFGMNEAQIRNDISLLKLKKSTNLSFPGVHFLGDDFYIDPSSEIEPGCFLDSREGSIIIGKNVHLMAGSQIKGSVAICDNSTTKMGAKIYGGTTIGPSSKVGGEVQNVVFQGFCNKAHEGFLGNSAIGEWCNFGADTNSSNLKNNYSTIRISDWETRTEIETGLQFCGLIMGDHSKTAINTALNTGTVCGVSTSIFASGFPPKYIPSFRWVSNDGLDAYKLDKALQTMQIIMKRRNVEITEPYKKMMAFICENDL